jgi:hypothetical protein
MKISVNSISTLDVRSFRLVDLLVEEKKGKKEMEKEDHMTRKGWNTSPAQFPASYETLLKSTDSRYIQLPSQFLTASETMKYAK